MSQEKHEQIEKEITSVVDGIIGMREEKFYLQVNEHTVKYTSIDGLKSRVAIYGDNSQLGRGTYGVVYTAKVYTDSYELKTLTYKKEKAVKVMHHVDAAVRELILKEYELGKRVAHLGINAPRV